MIFIYIDIDNIGFNLFIDTVLITQLFRYISSIFLYLIVCFALLFQPFITEYNFWYYNSCIFIYYFIYIFFRIMIMRYKNSICIIIISFYFKWIYINYFILFYFLCYYDIKLPYYLTY